MGLLGVYDACFGYAVCSVGFPQAEYVQDMNSVSLLVHSTQMHHINIWKRWGFPSGSDFHEYTCGNTNCLI